jgi:hypothetical protein
MFLKFIQRLQVLGLPLLHLLLAHLLLLNIWWLLVVAVRLLVVRVLVDTEPQAGLLLQQVPRWPLQSVLAVLVHCLPVLHLQQEAHQHFQQSMLLVVVKAVTIQPITLELVVLAVAVALMLAVQVVRLVTLVDTLLLKDMLVVATVDTQVPHTLRVVVAGQVRLVLRQLVRLMAAMVVLERQPQLVVLP